MLYWNCIWLCLAVLEVRPTNSSDIDTRIVGGYTYRRPWQAAVYYFPDGAWKQFVCGGSLLNRRWVLSAAHCIKLNVPYDRYKITLGDFDLDFHEGSEQYFTVSKAVYHIRFNPTTWENDVAMLRLDRYASDNKFVHAIPILLPHGQKEFDCQPRYCVTSGWGTLYEGGLAPRILREVKLPLRSASDCKNMFPRKMKPSMLCAGTPGGGGPCALDDGGPLACFMPPDWVLIGVMSQNQGCNKPTIYTNVTHILGFIVEAMKKHSTV